MVPEGLNPGLNFRNLVTSPHPELVRYRGDRQRSTIGRPRRDPRQLSVIFFSFLLISFTRTTGHLSSDVGENQIFFSSLVSVGMSEGLRLRNSGSERLLGRLWDREEVTAHVDDLGKRGPPSDGAQASGEGLFPEDEDVWKASPSRVYFWVLPECFFLFSGKTSSSALCSSLTSLFDSFVPTRRHVCLF